MMTSTIRKFGVGVASLALVAGVAGPALADPVDNRLAGADRYDTAIAVAMDKTEFASPSVVYVSRGDVLVDAVAAGSLLNGPMLLVNDDAAVQGKVAAAIGKLGVSKVVVVGGEKAVSKETLEKIVPAGVVTERIAGADRYETAVKIAEKFDTGKLSKVYLANGMTLVDALVGGQLLDGPILLTDGSGKLPEATAKVLNAKFYEKTVVALGGTKAVSEEELRAANVAKVILPQTFIQDFNAEIKAAGEAALKVNGYYTISSKADKEKVIDAAAGSDKLKRAKIEATWPKIDADLAPNGDYYIPTKEDGSIDTAVAQPAAKAKAVAYKAQSLDGGASAMNYMGTTKAVSAAVTALNNAKATITSSGAATNVFGIPGSTDSTVVIANALKGNEAAFGTTMATLQAVFPGKIKDDTTIKAFLESLGVTTWPTSGSSDKYLAQATDKNAATAAKTVFDNAVASAQAVATANAQTALTAAAKDDQDSKKVKKDADEALANRQSGRVPSGALDRISGTDRYSTSVAIAKSVFGDKGEKKALSRVYLANGESFSDAAVSGMLSAGPVVLVMKDSVPASSLGYIDDLDKALDFQRSQVVALGGSGVIADKNLTDEIERVAPANQASGSINFGTPTSASDKVSIPVTTKDLPNGSTLKLVWEYKDDTDNKSWVKIGDQKNVARALNPAQAIVDGAAELTLGNGATPKDALVRLTVETVARNGETITKVTSTPIKVYGLYQNTALTDGSGLSAAADQALATFTNWTQLQADIKAAKGSDPVAGDFTIKVLPGTGSNAGDVDGKLTNVTMSLSDGKVKATAVSGSSKKFKVEITIKGYGNRVDTKVTTGDIELPA